MPNDLNVHIGCEIIIRKDDTILLGKRKNSYGAGTWALPGGHLQSGEYFSRAICREISEELGAIVTPDQINFVSLVDEIEESGRQAIHVTFEFLRPKFEPKLMEPEFCEEWRYFSLKNLPLDNFFKPHKPIIANYLAGKTYSSQK